MKQRQTLIAQLWPLLAENQRKWLVKHTEQQLIDVLINADPKNSRFARLKKHNPTLKIAIVNLHALLKVSQGEELAQQYLPAIWGITGTSYYGRRMRREIMRGLLQQGKYQLATALIGKGLSTAKNDMAKLQYIQLQLTTISQSGLLPPRSFSRFLERQLRQLRPNVSATLWKQAALTLADRYLTWGNYQRAIWWIEVCRWSGGRAVRNDDRFLLRLARAWRRKGNEKLAKRFYGKVVQKAWTRFSKHAHDAFRQRILHAFFKSFIGRSYYSSYHRRYWQLYQIIQKHKGSWNQLVRKYRYSRYRYMMYRLIQHISWKSRRYKTQLKRSTFAIQTLYTLHHEAERKNELFSRLHKAWKSQTKPTSKQKYLFHLLAAYRLDWSKHRTPSSLQAMLTILRRLHRKSRPKPSTQIIALLGQIEAEAGHYKSAIKMYRTQLASIPPNKRNERIQLLRQIAQVYGQAGNQKAQRKAYLRLSTQYRDGIADKWLATHYLEMGRTNEAIRFYRQFQQRGIRTF
jgi:tetratricopeptide (TPR) repeat protein